MANLKILFFRSLYDWLAMSSSFCFPSYVYSYWLCWIRHYVYSCCNWQSCKASLRPCCNINFYFPLVLPASSAITFVIICCFINWMMRFMKYCLLPYWFDCDWLSVTKRCESVNTMASFLWWIVGFYWVVSGGNILLQDAPRLYWYASTTLILWKHYLFISVGYHTILYSFPYVNILSFWNLWHESSAHIDP